MTGVSIIFLSIVIVYLNSSVKGINGTLCSLTMLTEDIVQGVGLLKKTEFVKPYWYGLEGINKLVGDTNSMIEALDSSCTHFLGTMEEPFGTNNDGTKTKYDEILRQFPTKIGNVYTSIMNSLSTIAISNNPTTNTGTPYSITLLYIKSLGPPSDSSTDLGKILTDFQNNYVDVI
jgi:hypothetical protein